MWYYFKRKVVDKISKSIWKIGTKILSKGKIFHFPPGVIHQEKALTDVEIIEASTPHFNDRVRVEKKI